jgi:ComF family protein
MKRSGGDPLTTAVTQLLWKCHGREIGRWRPDVVVGVPLNWGKRIRRGTCTTEQIGRCLAKRLGVSYLGGALRCRRKLFVQAGLSPDSRRRNVRGAFAVGTGYDFSGAHLLLVDDVMTTGATVREVSRTLRRAGAEDISVAVLACSGDGGTGRLAI